MSERIAPVSAFSKSCKDARVDPEQLHETARERSARWENSSVEWQMIDGPQTPKPAAWLQLRTDTAEGQLTAWVSGEAEMDWSIAKEAWTNHAPHYDLESTADLRTCVDDLERNLGLTP
jgi:hypothetical protein